MNTAAISASSLRSTSPWRDVVLPREHGSWSLALEPLALGLLIAPSAAGGCLAVATLAGFLARRPLKIALRERAPARHAAATTALACAAAIVVAAFGGAVATGGLRWLPWLAPSAVFGGIFLSFDLKNAWRSEFAEIAGAAAFALMTGALAAAADCPALVAGALAFAMLARAVPTVIFVRAGVRGAKTGVLHAAPAVIAAALAVAGALALAWYGVAPAVLAVALTLLLARSAILLLVPPPHLRPRTLGYVELAVGAAYIAGLSWVWRSTIP